MAFFKQSSTKKYIILYLDLFKNESNPIRIDGEEVVKEASKYLGFKYWKRSLNTFVIEFEICDSMNFQRRFRKELILLLY